MLTDIDIHRLKRLIEKMNSSHRLSEYQKKMKKDARSLDYSREYTQEELDERAARFRASATDIRLKEPEKSDHHMGWQISMMDAMLDDYLNFDYPLAPHYPWRITVILRKGKRLDIERDFIEAYFRLFWTPRGSSTDTKLGERAIKIGINIPHAPDSTPAPPKMPIPSTFTAQGFTIAMERPYLPHLQIGIKNIIHEGGTSYHFDFAFHCKSCGGTIMTIPDDGDDYGDASCKACGIVFGPYGDVKQLAKSIAEYELKRRGPS